MERLLNDTLGKSDPIATPYLNKEAAEIWGRRIADLSNQTGKVKISELIGLFFNHAVQVLRAGQNREAIAAFARLEYLIESQGIAIFPEKLELLQYFKMLSYLRLGEQENCLIQHSSESCLFPIQGDGIHELTEGSRGAIGLLMERLKSHPGDRKSIWLLNVAYMTLGEYPHKVPSRWLIPPSAFESGIEIPPFKDIAPKVGLDVNGLAGGIIMDDFDTDGDLDLVVSSWGIRDPLKYFEHLSDGTFVEKASEAGLSGLTGGLNLLQADYDNDGNLDFLVLRGAWFGEEGRHPNSLIRNLGDGRFEDVTIQTGLLSFHPTQTAVWADFNGDGWLDLFIGNETTENSNHPCELFLNQTDGTFREVAAQAGLDHRAYVKGVTAGDYDNDGRVDLYISNRGQPNALFRNLRNNEDNIPIFRDMTQKAGVAEPLDSFPTWFFDFNNDGWLDLFVSGFKIGDVGDVAADVLGLANEGTRAKLYLNMGDGSFEDVSARMGIDKVLLAMGANFGDLNLDGYPDFYLGTGDPNLSVIIPNRMFLNDEGKGFLDVTTSGRFGHLQKGHGIAFADLDHDGDMDIYAVMGGAFSGDHYMNALFENPGLGGDWLVIELQGEETNRSAIGSGMRVKLKKGDQRRYVYATVGSGGSFGASPLRQHIGLGEGWDLEAFQVRWAGTSDWVHVKGIKKKTFYQITQTRESSPIEREYKALPFSGSIQGYPHSH